MSDTPDIAALIEEMTAKAEKTAARFWAAFSPKKVLALIAAYKAMTERAEAAERERDEAREMMVRGVCHDAVGDEWGHFPCPHKSKAEALVAELTEILGPVLGAVRRAEMLGDDDDDLRGIRLGILRRAARLLSPPKDAPGETTGAR